MTPEDREMLEMAARAAGYELALPASPGMRWSDEDRSYIDWNPLASDGDALRLAVKLRLTLMLELPRIGIGPRLDGPEIYIEYGEDEYAATRLAIVRAAAAIGRSMP